MKKYNVLTCVLIVSIIFVILVVANKKRQTSLEIPKNTINYIEEKENEEEEIEDEKKKIEDITNEHGFTANTEIYQIAKEYDGREVAIIKPSIQFKVAIAGAIKKSKPEFKELDELLKKAPNYTGIWVTQGSREQFLNLLRKITNSTYKLDGDGYLVQNESIIMNAQDNAINKMLNSGNLYVFDISSTSYIVDETNGNIEEYPFEEMDPHQGYEYLEENNKYMFVISENKMGEVSQEEILKEILK